jgi:hypothetical protein
MALRDEQALDLSALDPARDAAHFDAVVQSVVARSLAAREANVWSAVLRWWRPALALAAAVALALWAPSLVERDDELAVAEAAAPAYQLEQWASTGQAPSSVELLDASGRMR